MLRDNLDEHKSDEDATTKDGTFLLNAFVAQAETNVSRSKPGYRFDPLIKMFACFVKMIGGLLAYETLHANLPLSLPSTSTVDKFMKDKGAVIIEGKLRTEELIKYLKDRNLPLRVDLSEDATRITAKVGFDPKTNQLVGFALPLDKNGMPIPLSFDASTAKVIQDHFSNTKNYVSSSVVVVMAQPQSDTVPPFCLQLFLTDNTFTAEKILSRWNFTTHEMKQEGINVDNYSTDGDPRSLKVMKFKSQLGVTDLEFLNCEWYSGGDSCNDTYSQDATHIGGKARNRALKVSRITPIGSKLVSTTHLNYLIEHISKDKHLLTPHDVQPKDRQNFHSVEKICAPIVLSCLDKYVPDSEATAMFLKALNFAIYSYLDKKMTPADRVYKIWYAIFFFRVWRSWLIKSKYTLKESFISLNCYTCIELNGHTLVKQLLKTHADASYVFNPKQQGSQQCESMFRQVRSFSSTYSTVVNCSMLDIVNRIKKIQLQSDIMAALSDIIKFPRLEKKEQIAAASKSVDEFTPPSKDSIISWIEKAKSDLTKDMIVFGIDAIKLKLDFKCQIKPTDFEKEFECDDDDDELNDDEWDDNEIPEDEDDDFLNDMNPAEAIEFQKDLHKLSGVTGELSLPSYSHRGVEVDPKGIYAVVLDSKGEPDVVLKSAICWMLSRNKIKSSSDRLQRVQEKDYQPNCGKSNRQANRTHRTQPILNFNFFIDL